MFVKTLTRVQSGNMSVGIQVLILVPSSELCEQVYTVASRLTMYCHHLVRSTYITTDMPIDTQKYVQNLNTILFTHIT